MGVWTYLAGRIGSMVPGLFILLRTGVFGFPFSSWEIGQAWNALLPFFHLWFSTSWLPLLWFSIYSQFSPQNQASLVLLAVLTHKVKMVDASNPPSCPNSTRPFLQSVQLSIWQESILFLTPLL
jgi:hypothetical protein